MSDSLCQATVGFHSLKYSSSNNCEMFTKGKNPVINAVLYCKTAPAADPIFYYSWFLNAEASHVTLNDWWNKN